MIVFKNISNKEPYKIFKESYERAKNACQQNIEAVAISSYSKELDEVNSRFVNLKFIENEESIFFSNYKSQKSFEFLDNNSISALIYWPSINTACIRKVLSSIFNTTLSVLQPFIGITY